MKFTKICPVCMGKKFSFQEILWEKLIDEWELKEHEAEYINLQQGFYCVSCGNNLRSMALADTILRKYKWNEGLKGFVESDMAQSLRILEVNEAGGLNAFLKELPGHVLVKYPTCDMENLPFEHGVFDIVVHSDTLEHIVHPVVALSECRRVLAQSGSCFFTVPLVMGRLSRSRKGLKDSFHGDEESSESDLIVRTEFGSDVWEYAMKAGFRAVLMNNFEYPAAVGIEAVKN